MIPCEGCLIIPICRHKSYFKLMDDCPVLHRYLYRETLNGQGFKIKLINLSTKLNPTEWQPLQIFKGSQRLGGIATK
jgi:hypothetical protein